MSRLPIRARLTAAFALAMVLVLVAAGLFVYLRLQEDLDENLDKGLRARVAEVAALDLASLDARGGQPGVEVDDSFAQVVDPDGGRVLYALGGLEGTALAPEQLREAARGEVRFERQLPGVEGTTRVIARPAAGAGSLVVVAGQSLDDRDEALAGLVTSFGLGGPLAVLVASLLGYALATAGLRPVEAMRRRAGEVSLGGRDERLPLPAARDEIHRLGETLNEMLDRLGRSFDRERQFVADASHELRTPVAVLKTELEGALRTGDYGPEVREALVAAVEECDHLAQLAEDLLVLARAAEGGLPVRPEDLGVRGLFEGLSDRFADRAEQQGRSIRVDAPESLRVTADPLRMRQALGNLVDNALRHGEGDVTLSARSAAGGVELDVADEGPGFEPAIAGAAFERFTRGDQARTRGGAGLGMAIVAAVAKAHGGRAAIGVGGATAGRVWVPVAAGDRPGVSSPRGSGRSSASSASSASR